ncbi:hypothetical protein P170DRAFT_26140 [Aspergillus steynii IBT 23096]|uniref:Uncharacterized protein n=1 Tax=Aspergillus steynii IBT 23096 TaxID=1392250 RepID=A0A2I2GPP2_9EURO|nr:uncharacterized protein P170DRAFT_26140 [Aspergillus steynii IBT 23096]PLB54845.1 hypothetical protein P170DRAFT_26140 [Aspergillus steynii IBT 23096]
MACLRILLPAPWFSLVSCHLIARQERYYFLQDFGSINHGVFRNRGKPFPPS